MIRSIYDHDQQEISKLMLGWNVQVATWTSNNRYPGIFRTVQSRIAERLGPCLGAASLKILSFGCSNGSEVSTLRSYFPEALIYACDVNPAALRSADELLLMDEAVVFLSSPESIAEHGPYDVVFAMSVLCRFPESADAGLMDLRPLYRFEDFKSATELLVRNLNQHGIICFYNTSYDFLQTDMASNFRIIKSALVASNGFVDRFDPDGRRMTWSERIGPYYAHRLHCPGGSGPGLDFTSCIFEASSGARGDIWVGFGDKASARPASPPDLVRFGPDLVQCAERRLVSTALSYWFQQSPAGTTIVRAWSRSTPDGTVEHGTPWAVRGGEAARSALAADRSRLVPPAPRRTGARRIIGGLRRVNRRLEVLLK